VSSKVVLWDFDGTLAWRDGLWRSALSAALDSLEPGHGIDPSRLRGRLSDGFPWHEPDRPHPELSDPDRWWARIEARLARAFEEVGYRSPRSLELAHHARHAFLAPASYQVFGDTIPTLNRIATHGWRHAIVSNHVPELEDIVEGVGLREHFEVVVSSALVGYEKPHPAIFHHALALCGRPECVWMVGDNPVADVRGSESLGIRAILVRRDGDALRKSPDLVGAGDMILAEDGS